MHLAGNAVLTVLDLCVEWYREEARRIWNTFTLTATDYVRAWWTRDD